jgi:hypothetical protein
MKTILSLFLFFQFGAHFMSCNPKIHDIKDLNKIEVKNKVSTFGNVTNDLSMHLYPQLFIPYSKRLKIKYSFKKVFLEYMLSNASDSKLMGRYKCKSYENIFAFVEKCSFVPETMVNMNLYQLLNAKEPFELNSVLHKSKGKKVKHCFVFFQNRYIADLDYEGPTLIVRLKYFIRRWPRYYMFHNYKIDPVALMLNYNKEYIFDACGSLYSWCFTINDLNSLLIFMKTDGSYDYVMNSVVVNYKTFNSKLNKAELIDSSISKSGYGTMRYFWKIISPSR